MPSRIVTFVRRPKRALRKRKAVALKMPAIVTKATLRKAAVSQPASDTPKQALPPGNDDTPAAPAPPAAKSVIVTTANRKRSKVNRPDRPELPDDPEADARVKAFLARTVRPGGALPTGKTVTTRPIPQRHWRRYSPPGCGRTL